MPAINAIPMGDILDIIRQRVTDETTRKQIVADLNAAQKELAAEKAAEKAEGLGKTKNKYRLVALVRGDASLKPLVAGGAFIVAVPDMDTPEAATYAGDALLERIYKAARMHNQRRQGVRGRPLVKMNTFFEVLKGLKPKAIRASESAFKVKCADPIEVVVVEREDIP